jgi:PAS domain S-box-containing protein
LRLLAADGGIRPVELTLRRVNWAGQAAALITCVDHSDFQHVQAMLQSMSGMLRQIVDGAPVASYVIDRHHRITHWNEACARLTGHAADEMLGTVEAWRAFYDQPHLLLADWVVDGIDPRTLDTHYGNTVRPSTLVPGAFEAEVQIPDLAPGGIWLLVNTVPLRDHAGEITGAIVTLQDVTQSRRTEQELTRRLEQMLEERSAELAAHARVLDAFVDNAPMGVVYAADTTVLRSNPRMVEIFGLAREAIDPSEVTEGREFFIAREDVGMLRKMALPHLSRGEPLHHEMWMRHASGRQVWVQVNAYAVDPGNKNTGVWWMLQDRTDVRAAQQELHQRFEQLQATNAKLEQAQNQLLQNDKMASIGQLAAGVAHEINNPVGFVSSNLSTLRQYVQSLLNLADAYADARAAPGDADLAAQLVTVIDDVELDYLKEDLPQLLDESADGLNRVKKIVQDLKDFSRVDQADWQQADLNAGLESTLNVVRNEVKYKAEVVKNLGTLPLVLCLAGQLNQVFMNLIVNASHAIKDKGVITLSSGAAGKWAWVQVDDTGCGMTEDVQRRIFEPFYTTKDVGKGTGLGLSLSFSIMQRHGGAIRVRSVLGQGSSFRVWVPVDGPGNGAAAEPPAWD